MWTELLGIAGGAIAAGEPLYWSSPNVVSGFDSLPGVTAAFWPKPLMLNNRGQLRASVPISEGDRVWLKMETGEVFGESPRRPEAHPETWRDRPPLL